jgi:hypothetical protein
MLSNELSSSGFRVVERGKLETEPAAFSDKKTTGFPAVFCARRADDRALQRESLAVSCRTT